MNSAAAPRGRSLWTRFLVVLLAVSTIALSAAFVLRTLMIRDFGDFLEGEREDRIYWITADLERTYAKHGGWDEETLEEDALWALTLGFEVRIADAGGRPIMDTQKALASLPRALRQRGFAGRPSEASQRPYVAYPLFIGGESIGTLEVSSLKPRKEAHFIERSNLFLLGCVAFLGGLAVVLSAVASRGLTRPLKRLTAAAAAVREGNLAARVPVEQHDEVGLLAETFNGMAQALQRLEELRKRLLTDVAHELRTPLGAMRAELEGMMDGLIPTANEQLQSLHDETGRLKRMLDGMEDLAHAQASSLTIRKEAVPLEPLLKNIVDRAATAMTEKGIGVALECEPRLLGHADPDKLGQIVLNLVDNAVKASTRGTVNVRAARSGADVVIEVEDEGVGVASTDLPFIFERFYHRSKGGLGVGLAIVKELVDAHGGSIEVESEPGRGSLFRVRLPG